MPHNGTLTVICGPMFAGKSDLLITLASNVPEAVRSIYYPEIDTRYEAGYVTAHNGRKLIAHPINLKLRGIVSAPHVFIDEAQFLDKVGVYEVIGLVKESVHVTLAGLDLTSGGDPFGQMTEFLCLANRVIKIQGTCAKCGGHSTRTYRKPGVGGETVLIGKDEYEPRCFSCWNGF